MPLKETPINAPVFDAVVETSPAVERALMQAAQGDLRQFAPLYEQYAPRLYAYCRRRSATEQEAEDLTSQVFTRALGAIRSYQGGHVGAWLFQIARNVLIDHWEREQRHDHSPLDKVQDQPAPYPSPAEVVAEADEQAHLRELIRRLPRDQQEVIDLKLSAGLSAEEIGLTLGKSAGTVRVALHRAIKRLQKWYQASVVGDFQEEVQDE